MNEFSILLVEDNEDDRFLISRILGKLPFTLKIETAKNGDDALTRIMADKNGTQHLPSLILLDLQLPKIDGIKFLTSIRGRYSQKKLPVIILSSSDNPGDIASCRELGINGYLEKPLELSQLHMIMENLVGNQQGSLLSAPQQGSPPEKFV